MPRVASPLPQSIAPLLAPRPPGVHALSRGYLLESHVNIMRQGSKLGLQPLVHLSPLRLPPLLHLMHELCHQTLHGNHVFNIGCGPMVGATASFTWCGVATTKGPRVAGNCGASTIGAAASLTDAVAEVWAVRATFGLSPSHRRHLWRPPHLPLGW